MSELYETDPLMVEETIEDWVITKCEDWRDYYESNYEARFEEYYRLWRGQWDPADSQRGSCLLYTSPSPRDGLLSRMPSSA